MGDGSAALRRRLNDSLRAALKTRNASAAAALRSAIGAIDNAEAVQRPDDSAPQGGKAARSHVGVGVADVARRELSTDDVVEILRAEIADRTSVAADYERKGRDNQAASLRAEAAVLISFLDEM
jgi:uncharacterized protein YqeY